MALAFISANSLRQAVKWVRRQESERTEAYLAFRLVAVADLEMHRIPATERMIEAAIVYQVIQGLLMLNGTPCDCGECSESLAKGLGTDKNRMGYI